MANETIDALLLELTDPSLARPLPPAIATARTDIFAAARDLLAIPEAALELPWTWIAGGESEVRYGAYRAVEALEQAEIQARTLATPADAHERRAAGIVGPSTAARWDLHGLLLPLADELLDADPGGAEWSIRLVMGHLIAGQRGYAWTAAWVQAHGPDPDDPGRQVLVPESFWDSMPDEATTEAAGTVDDLRARLDAITDLAAERLAGLPDDRLEIPTRWSGFPVPLSFRFGRWSSHIREHTIQVEKTLALLGHVPGEPERLVRLVLAAYGRAESVVFGRVGVDHAVDRVVIGAAEARAAVSKARRSAEA
ncbi:MAG: DinB family protein [Candidatus Limnocylindrales bacterium]